MDDRVKINKLYKHFKGDVYRVINIAKHSENGEELVIYQNLVNGKTWARPIGMFLDKVDKEKYPDAKQEYRFEQVYQIHTNNDPKFVSEMIKKLRENGGYCPCSLIKNEDTKCMCKEFRESKELAPCTCGLYYKSDD